MEPAGERNVSPPVPNRRRDTQRAQNHTRKAPGVTRRTKRKEGKKDDLMTSPRNSGRRTGREVRGEKPARIGAIKRCDFM
ncbi:hypothetical protein L596_000907 [Steinernema carpocapsae]|uniref:Uncharacterized protein n=1 Tax=Steinernema carpocapsae TaxID=34508 RepID=A0A4V6I6Z2_STECR|nr:hypothetical protein L596_000907 [Steinernema carpocapsae]